MQYREFVKNYANQKLKEYKTFDHLNRKLSKTATISMCVALSDHCTLTPLVAIQALKIQQEIIYFTSSLVFPSFPYTCHTFNSFSPLSHILSHVFYLPIALPS